MIQKTVVIIGTRGYPSYYGGFETAVRKIAPYLAQSGEWNVTVYGRPGATKPNDPELEELVSTVVTKGFETKSLSTLSYGFTASLLAAKAKPDVALVMNVANGFFLPFLKLRGIKTVVNVDGIEWDRQKWGRLAKLIFKLGARFTAKYADELVFDAKAIEDRWQRDFGRTGTFIPYGGEIRERLPLEPDLMEGEYVLVVARFVPENTIPEFFDAITEITKTYTVVIVGSSGYGGDLDQRAEKIARENNKVLWLGHVSDDLRLLGLWKHAGVYFHGHSVGGTNPTLVQAMTLGCTVVARDTIYNREVLDDGGIFCQPDSTSISEAIIQTLNNTELRKEASSKNKSRAHKIYSWDHVNRSYRSVLNTVTDRTAIEQSIN